MKFESYYIVDPGIAGAIPPRKVRRYEVSEIEAKLKDYFPFARFWGVDDLKKAHIILDQNLQTGCNVIIQKNVKQTKKEIVESIKKQINAYLGERINSFNSLRKGNGNEVLH